ncbi:MAG: hypothetical protein ACM34M_07895, partial [Ignavibacteria bacterium]
MITEESNIKKQTQDVSRTDGKIVVLETQIERFSRLNRMLHVLMIISFISLALTGMTLKFFYTGWAVFLSKF